jgi:hypothetical protein
MSLFLLSSVAAWACSIAADPPFEVQPDPDDTVAPMEPLLQELDIRRGKGPEAAGCGRTATTSCDDIGFITLTFAQPEGDAHDAAEIGYRVRYVGGTLPHALEPPEGLWAGPSLHLHWIDGATDDQEPFAFELEVVAVDAAGNESPPLRVDVVDGAQNLPGTCSSLPALGGGWPLLAMAWGVRRRGIS